MASKVNVKEYKVKLAKQDKDNAKKYYLMRFRPPHQVNLADMVSPTLDRQHEAEKVEEAPTFGEGSEYGKKRREEARKRKYGIVSKKMSADDHPWELREQKKGGKHFIGRKEGGVNSNSAYYVLTHCQDGTFEALPISGWYDFVPTIKYNYLDAEEAEKKFEQRHKTLNYFSVMLSKKVQSKDDDESKSDAMLISDIARGRGAIAAASDSDSNDEGGHKGRKKGRPSSSKKSSKMKKKAGEDDDDNEDDDQTTDEGEMESREVDYISDDSSGPSSDEQRNDKEAEPKRQQKKQVGESLVSDTSSESSEEELDDSGKAILALMKKQEDTNNSSGSDEAEEIDAMDQSQFLPLKSENANNVSSAKSSGKREATSDAAVSHSDEPAAKKLKLSTSTTTITVDEVKYYLMRKPITATDLAKKFRSKKKDMDKLKVIARLGEIIQKNLNVERKTVQGKTYLSIKSS